MSQVSFPCLSGSPAKAMTRDLPRNPDRYCRPLAEVRTDRVVSSTRRFAHVLMSLRRWRNGSSAWPGRPGGRRSGDRSHGGGRRRGSCRPLPCTAPAQPLGGERRGEATPDALTNRCRRRGRADLVEIEDGWPAPSRRIGQRITRDRRASRHSAECPAGLLMCGRKCSPARTPSTASGSPGSL